MLWGTEARGGECKTVQGRGHGQRRLWGGGSAGLSGSQTDLGVNPGSCPSARATTGIVSSSSEQDVHASLHEHLWGVGSVPACAVRRSQQGTGLGCQPPPGPQGAGLPGSPEPGLRCGRLGALLAASPLCFECFFAASLGPSSPLTPPGPTPLLACSLGLLCLTPGPWRLRGLCTLPSVCDALLSQAVWLFPSLHAGLCSNVSS